VAKKSKIVNNDRRREIVARYAQRRAELKEIIRSPSSTGEQRTAAQRQLARSYRPATTASLHRDQECSRNGAIALPGAGRGQLKHIAPHEVQKTIGKR
jgi:small subunit ribosomal protein S14